MALTIVGGLGYIGKEIARQASKEGIKVFAVSRSATEKFSALNAEDFKTVTPIDGDSMNPESFASAIKDSKAIVHLVGTLLSKKSPGEIGSYEHMNRDSAISMSNFISQNSMKKKFIYMSASKAPPFLPRYLKTKREAEQALFKNPNLEAFAFRAGFVVSFEERKISIPIAHLIDFNRWLYAPFVNSLPNLPFKEFLHEFEFTENIQLSELASLCIDAGIKDKMKPGFYENSSLNHIIEKKKWESLDNSPLKLH